WPPLPLKTHRQVTERQAAQLTRLCPQGEPNCPRSRAIESTQANDLRRPPRLNRKTHCAQQSNTRSRIKADFRSLRESLSCVRKLGVKELREVTELRKVIERSGTSGGQRRHQM